MQIDRRSFLSFIIGGAAGTTLSPLPWKLTDDLSIWSQNWPWTPVPEAGEVSYTTSACTLCPAGCGISVRKVEDRVVKIEGLKGHPINDGGLCILGLSGAQLLYGPSRVKTPKKRMGNRGQGRWADITWDQALSEVAAKLAELRSKHQSHTLACITGAGRGTVPRLFHRFLTAYGSPNFIQTTSIRDSYELAFHQMLGADGPVGFDIENTDFLLSFGAGILEGWDSPVRMFRANSARRERGGILVQVEHRLSNTAAKADLWIPIQPGTEAVLALGLADIIIKDALYNREFVNNHASGFGRFKDWVASQFSLELVSEKTGIDKTTIITLARDFARSRNPLAVCGRGQGRTPQRLGEVMAVQALNGLMGNINQAGGVWSVPEPDYIGWGDPEMDRTATQGVEKSRIDGAGTQQYPATKHLPNRLAEVIHSGKAYPIEVLLVSGANPCYTLPDSSTVKQAIEKIPFVVSFSPYLDETAQMADYILPDHTNLERYEDIPAPAGYPKPFIGLVKPVVAPQFNTRHVGDTILSLAKALGGTIAGSFPWDSYEACIQETLGDKWETLQEQGYWIDAANQVTSRSWAFSTSTGKFEFPAPDGSIGPVEIEGDANAYPLILVPYDSMRLANAYIGNPPFLTKTVADTVIKGKDGFVEINPATAKSLGLSEGRSAQLKTPRGAVRVKVHLSERIGPGLVALPRGLGHTAYDKFLSGKGVNYNDLVGPVEDPASGLDAAWGIRAKLSRA